MSSMWVPVSQKDSTHLRGMKSIMWQLTQGFNTTWTAATETRFLHKYPISGTTLSGSYPLTLDLITVVRRTPGYKSVNNGFTPDLDTYRVTNKARTRLESSRWLTILSIKRWSCLSLLMTNAPKQSDWLEVFHWSQQVRCWRAKPCRVTFIFGNIGIG